MSYEDFNLDEVIEFPKFNFKHNHYRVDEYYIGSSTMKEEERVAEKGAKEKASFA